MNTMQNSFYWGDDITLLFSNLMVASVPAYVAALAVLFLFCLLHEFLHAQRTAVSWNSHREQQSTIGSQPRANFPPGPQKSDWPSTSESPSSSPLDMRLWSSALYAVNTASSYLLMLLIMTFNGGVFITIVCGLAIGHFLFGAQRHVDGDLASMTP